MLAPLITIETAGPTGPMLAPRGVALAGNGVLVVADTGNNRVLLWKSDSYLSGTPPDVVLGVGRATLSVRYPSGIWTDGNRLMVADAWNHRVLVWHRLPDTDGQLPDVVIGQPDLGSTLPNVAGLKCAPTARSLYWPYGLCSDGKSLWIADTGNRRVLYYEDIPAGHYAAADLVIGQATFDTRESDNNHALWPYAVTVGPNGELAVADTQYFRVLLWHEGARAFTAQADVLLGQPDFMANGQNRYLPTPDAHTLNWCYGCCFSGSGIWVADTGNSRLLHWPGFPATSGMPATGLVGQPHFRVIGESSLSMATPGENELYWPFSVAVANNVLAVADTGNHRIRLYRLPD